MKVQRYNVGRSNVGMLEQGRSALRSPEAVAAEKYAPYGALAEASKSIANDMNALAENDKKLQAEEDNIQMELSDKNYDFGYNQIINDERFNDELQPDGRPSREVMREELQTFKEGWIKDISLIQDDKTREYYNKTRQVAVAQKEADFERVIQEKREAWTTKGLFDLRTLAVEVEDYDEARRYTEELRDKGAIKQDAYEVDLKQIRVDELDTQSDVFLKEYEDAYRADEGDEFYKSIVNNDTIDPDLKKAALTKIENQKINFQQIKQKEIQTIAAGLLDTKVQMRVAIAEGRPLPMTIEEFVAKGHSFNDPGLSQRTSQWEQELRLARVSGIKTDIGYQEFLFGRDTGRLFDNNATNKKYLDREMEQSVNPTMSPEQMEDRFVDIQTDAGFLSAKTEEFFSTSPRTAESLASAAPLWGRMMINPDVNRAMDTKIDEARQTVLTDTWRAIQAGVPPLEAAQAAIEMGEKWATDTAVMTARQNWYMAENQGRETATESFDEMIDQKFDSTALLGLTVDYKGQDSLKGGVVGHGRLSFGQGEFTFEGGERDARARYEKYFYDAAMRSNDMETAAMEANSRFMETHSFNNLNGDWTVEFNGAKGNINSIYTEYMNVNRDESVVLTTDAGLTGSTIGNLDDAKFVNPHDTPNGKRYELWDGNTPVMADVEKTVDGRKVVVREQVYNTVTNTDMDKTALAEIEKDKQKEIERLEDELQKAEAHLKTTNIYGRGSSSESIRNAPNKIEKKRAELKAAKDSLAPTELLGTELN